MARPSYARRRRLHRQGRPGGLPLLARLLILTGVLGVLGVAAAAAATLQVYRTYADDLETMDEVLARQNLGPAKIYDRHGTLLHTFEDPHEGLRDPVPLSQISQNLIDATIATEDQSFWTNEGINVRGLLRAGYENLVPGAEQELFKGSGGSSITQQLVKNVFIPFEERGQRSVDRKIKETIMAVELTDRYSKEQILEWYLNSICYGNRACGIEAAAQRYFGVSAKDLTLAQAAMLAGIPQYPSEYDPYRNLNAAKQRQAQVLDLLHEWDPEKYPREVTEAAKTEPLVFREDQEGNPFKEAQHFVEYVRDQLIKQYGEEKFWTGGLRVTTTLDLELQHLAEQVVEEQVSSFERFQSCGCHNASLVTMVPNTGEVLAMVGSRKRDALEAAKQYESRVWDIRSQSVVRYASSWEEAAAIAAQDDADPNTNFLRVWTPAPDWNNALDVNHPGSSFKPVVYLAAFLHAKWNPATTIWDTPKRWQGPNGPITPTNPNGRFLGPLPVREALGSSLNLPAWKAAEAAGVENVVNLAHRMGINMLDNELGYGPSIATGGADLSLLDLTYVYAVLANNGTMAGVPTQPVGPGRRDLDPVVILEITDPRGNVIYHFDGPTTKEVVPPAYAWQITSILTDDSSRRLIGLNGGYLLLSDRPVAAKTGTQQGFYNIGAITETWTLGYTPDLVTGVWVGNEDNTPLTNISSANTAAYIWRLFMNQAHRQLNLPPREFTPPPDAVRATVQVAVPDGSCKNTTTRTEWFAADNRPPANYDPLKPPPDPDVQAWIGDKNCGKDKETPTPTPTPPVTPTPASTPTPAATPTPTPTPTPTLTPAPTPTGGGP